MNWYNASKVVTAKHWNMNTSFCRYCGKNLVPFDIVANKRHIFTWGQLFKCSCGKSGVWTNSVRDETEIQKIVAGEPLEGVQDGFCNDLFCPFCWEDVRPLQNGVYFIDNGAGQLVEVKLLREGIQVGGDELITDRDTIRSVLSNMTGSDRFGCASKQHNDGIIHKGYSYEYGEGEYGPIYEWFKRHVSDLPPGLLPSPESVQI